MDKEKVKQAISLLLEGIGENPAREGLNETPERIARMVEEIYGGLCVDPSIHFETTFSVSNNEMIIEKDITFYSTCEHHLLPFYGVAHIGYIPNNKVAGLSKLARVVDVYAKRPQIQERMGIEIAEAFMKYLQPKGVIVMIEAEHMCMSMRGIKKPGAKTITYVTRGEFEEDTTLCDTFFKLLK